MIVLQETSCLFGHFFTYIVQFVYSHRIVFGQHKKMLLKMRQSHGLLVAQNKLTFDADQLTTILPDYDMFKRKIKLINRTPSV